MRLNSTDHGPVAHQRGKHAAQGHAEHEGWNPQRQHQQEQHQQGKAEKEIPADHQRAIAQRLLAELQERQVALASKQQGGGEITQDEIAALRRLQGAARSNPTIWTYLEALQQAQAFLPEINTSISELLGFDFASLARSASG